MKFLARLINNFSLFFLQQWLNLFKFWIGQASVIVIHSGSRVPVNLMMSLWIKKVPKKRFSFLSGFVPGFLWEEKFHSVEDSETTEGQNWEAGRFWSQRQAFHETEDIEGHWPSRNLGWSQENWSIHFDFKSASTSVEEKTFGNLHDYWYGKA